MYTLVGVSVWRGGKNDTETILVVSRSGGGGVDVLGNGDVATLEVFRGCGGGYCGGGQGVLYDGGYC